MEIKGTTFTKDLVVVILIDDDEIPCFAIISEFVITKHSDILFVCKLLSTGGFSKHYHAYQVSSTDEIIVFEHCHLCDYHPLSCFTVSGSDYHLVCPKYHLLPDH